MAKKNLKQYKGGGQFWQNAGDFAGNYGKAMLDTSLSLLGADDVINEDSYKGSSAKDFAKISNISGGIAKGAMPIIGGVAGTMLGGPTGGMIGMQMAKGVQGVGGVFNPELDPNGMSEQTSYIQGQKVGNALGATSGLVPGAMGAFGKKMPYGGAIGYDQNAMLPMGVPSHYSEAQMDASLPRWARKRGDYVGGGDGNIGGGTAPMFAMGGTFQVDGPSHENGGVVINSPNGTYEVEKQEAIKIEPNQDKILSDRLKHKGTGKTYAKAFKPFEQLKQMAGKLPENVRDNITAAVDNKFEELFQEQEMNKELRKIGSIQRDMLACGGMVKRMANGGIHIKPENRGKFTLAAKRAGMGVQEYADYILSNKEDFSSTLIKRANFANNAANWEKANGGLVQYPNGGSEYGTRKFMTEKATNEAEWHEFAKSKGWQPAWTGDGTHINEYYDPKEYYRDEASGGFTRLSDKGKTVDYSKDPNYKPFIQFVPYKAPKKPISVAAPGHKPIQFGNLNYDPNNNTYYNPINKQAVTNQTISFKYGGLQKFEDGGAERIDMLYPTELSRELKTPYSITNPIYATNPLKINDSNKFDPDLIDKGNKLMSGINPNTGKKLKTGKGPYPESEARYKDLLEFGKQAGTWGLNNLGNLYNIKRGSTAEKEEYKRIKPTLLSDKADLEANNRMARMMQKQLKGAVAGNAGTYLSNMGQVNANRVYADMAIRGDYANKNAMIANDIAARNAAIQQAQEVANAANRGQARNVMATGLTGLGQNTAAQITDIDKTKMDQKTLEYMYKNFPYLKQFGSE